MSQYWFKPKRYGLGASPTSWEGWAVTAVYVAAIAALALRFGDEHGQHSVAFIAIGTALTIVFVGICWAKTEGGWHWRWGDNDRR